MKLLLYMLILAVAQLMHSQDLTIMSYNIRLDLESDGDNKWDNRKDLLAGQVLFHEPDFMGVQEALHHQMQYLKNTLNDYSYIGTGRDDGKEKGEYSAIFYNSKKFRLLQHDTFWLSATPDKVSLGWDAAYNRICTYGLFENRETHQQMWVFNTHFDHVGSVARIESAKLLLKKIEMLNKQKLPVIVTGDFNLESNHESIQLIAAKLNDSKAIAGQVFGPDGTFNAFQFEKPVTKRIDYIFTSSNIKVNKYAVLSDSKNCRYPSDHLPVYVEVSFK